MYTGSSSCPLLLSLLGSADLAIDAVPMYIHRAALNNSVSTSSIESSQIPLRMLTAESESQPANIYIHC